MRAAGGLRNRVDRTVVALRPVLSVQEDLSHIHQLDQEGRAQPRGAPGLGLHRVARYCHTSAIVADTYHLLLGLTYLVPPGSQQRLEGECNVKETM